jgi:putative xylitol transport system ATP-binding protein
MGSGRSAFATALYGCARVDGGAVFIEGQPVLIRSPSDALRLGIAMVTEDRKQTGLALTSSVRENISVSSLARFARFGFIDERKEAASVDALIQRFEIKVLDREQPVRELSGGNQQKVVFARALLSHPKILICDEPTRGVDEGAKRQIHAFLRRFAADGNAVLMISSEIPEIISQSDRIVIFRRGRVAAELRPDTVTPDALLHLAS